MTSLFITGTDTNVGKTVVSSLLSLYFKDKSFAYIKPVQTNVEEDSDENAVAKLANVQHCFTVQKYSRPLSPHLSAFYEDKVIDFHELIKGVEKIQNNFTDTIIEGAGGLLVPLNKKYFIKDIPKTLDIKVILVIKNILGCINHSLLSIALLKSENIAIHGLVFVGSDNVDNINTVKKMSGIENILCVPLFDDLSSSILKNYFANNEQAITKFLQGYVCIKAIF